MINSKYIKKTPLVIGLLVTVLNLFTINSTGQENSGTSSSLVDDFKELPKIDWVFKINSQIYSSPIVSDSVVYFGGLDSTLYAISTKTRDKIWMFKTKGEIRSNVCIDGKNLFLNGGDGALYTLDKLSGVLVWKFETKGEKKYDFADYFQSSPVLVNGVLYFGSGDGNLYAINSQNGTLVWKYQTGNVVHTTPAIDNNKIFFGSFDGNVYALNLSSGELIWKFKTVGHQYFPRGEVQGSPFAHNHLVFIGARDYNIYAIDQEKGYCHWNKAYVNGWGLCNNVHDSVLYIGSSDERVLVAANPQTGKEYWRKKMEFLVFGNNAYSQNMLYVGTTIGKLHGISLDTGEKVWSFETFTYQKNRFKYFKPDDSFRDDIYSIIKSNEHYLEVQCELGGIFSTPYITDKAIYFTSTNGMLYCLKR